MPFPIPEPPRVLFDKNPLAEVICQLRFPTILNIDSEPPASFQSHVRQEFPLFREKRGEKLDEFIPPELLKAIPSGLPFRLGANSYEFVSRDEYWSITLNRDFLALTSRQYSRWEEFKAHLQIPLAALIEEYSPAFFSRVGLRYQDVIQKSKLNLQDVNWSALLKPPIAGEMSASEINQKIEERFSQVVIRLDSPGGRVRMQHGLARLEGSNEECYLIDSDFYTEEQTEISDVIGVLDTFNQQAGHLFRWCITEELYQAMSPHPIGNTGS